VEDFQPYVWKMLHSLAGRNAGEVGRRVGRAG